MLCDWFPHLPPAREADADTCYRALFGEMPVEAWTPKGTLLIRIVNGRQLSFAARRTHCTVGFHGKDAIHFYRDFGGEHPVGEVTIKIPHDAPIVAGPIHDAIEWYFHN